MNSPEKEIKNSLDEKNEIEKLKRLRRILREIEERLANRNKTDVDGKEELPWSEVVSKDLEIQEKNRNERENNKMVAIFNGKWLKWLFRKK